MCVDDVKLFKFFSTHEEGKRFDPSQLYAWRKYNNISFTFKKWKELMLYISVSLASLLGIDTHKLGTVLNFMDLEVIFNSNTSVNSTNLATLTTARGCLPHFLGLY